jgi:hypothetical protein
MTDKNKPPSSESPGYATAARSYSARPVRHTPYSRMFIVFGVTMAVVIAAVVGASLLINRSTTQPHCPEDCQAPPIGPPKDEQPTIRPGPPVPTALPGASGPHAESSSDAPSDQLVPHDRITPFVGDPVISFERYQSDDKSFSVAYFPVGLTKKFKNGVSFTWDRGKTKYDHATVLFFGVPAEGRTPQEITQVIKQKNIPSGRLGYVIPNAQVGYQKGYGEFVDYDPQSSSGSSDPQRAIIMVAVKNGLALITFAAGPYHEPDDMNHASGANLDIAMSLGYFVNSFMWKGDPPR